ncbi:ATP-binding cassette sub-family G member 4 [Thelohanellus kitauei]|uniref:ATP-binding cassette sub-family G member 4 n=1 Tax=Thelohanellus kitauei TaxID=669202 RepID=A0A0C2IJY2_THEKT|nr:ATP-binding cassette sub-family G member 4 [Thelohanellus kitauei]
MSESSVYEETPIAAMNESSSLLSPLPASSYRSSYRIGTGKELNMIKRFVTVFTRHLLQFVILSQRSLRATLRDKMFTYLRLATTILMALLLGLLYYKIGNDGSNVINNLGCIFFTLIYLIFICLMPTVLTFPMEKTVFIREHLNNWYNIKAYYLAKTFSDLPFQILLPIIYCLIMYYMSGQPTDFRRTYYFIQVVIMAVLVSQSIGLVLGAIAPNSEVAVFVAPVSGIPLLLFCGYFVRFSVIPIYFRWFTYVSYARYAWEGAVLSIYGNNRGNLECKISPCMFNNGEEVLKFLDISEDAMGIKNFRLTFCIIMMGLFFIILRLLAYIILRATISNRKK